MTNEPWHIQLSRAGYIFSPKIYTFEKTRKKAGDQRRCRRMNIADLKLKER